jgi:Zn-dependent protease with chaperone function
MIDAIYFDGRTTRRQPVTMVMLKGVVAVRGDGIRHSMKLSRIDISERLEHAPRIMRFPDGEYVEISSPGLDKLLAANGYQDPWVVRWQQNWLLSLSALISLLALLIAGYQWGLPQAADKIAQHLPAALAQKIGDAQLKLIDAGYMQPSTLDPVNQLRLQRLFSELKQPRGEKTSYRLEFRHSQFGPNAFALPNGVIIMTDQLVMLANNDQAVLAVLGHELGHVQRRHSLRRLLQVLGVGVVINIIIGDVSSALAALPTFLLDQKYSRDFEREADQYAIDMMLANSVPLAPMAQLFEKMRDAHTTGYGNDQSKDSAGHTADSTTRDGQDENDEQDDEAPKNGPKGKTRRDAPIDYLSSHPSDEERIARLLAADKK